MSQHTSIAPTGNAQFPAIGLGTYNIRGYDGAHAITDAIELGYRYIDTAYNYENEGVVGQAILQSTVDREDIQVASKLPGRYHEAGKARIAIEEGLMRSGLEYFDVYLIHWPLPRQDRYVEAWEALIRAREDGLVRHIGVSNFLPEHIDRLEQATGVKPIINQVELHPYFQQRETRLHDEKKWILTQGWSPLGARARSSFDTPIHENPVLLEIAEQHGATVNQVILSWHLSIGVMPLPKSANHDRLAENLAAQDVWLTKPDVLRIGSLDREDGRINDQDPATYEEF